MKKISFANYLTHALAIIGFLVILGLPVAADTGQHPSLSQLSAQLEALTDCFRP